MNMADFLEMCKFKQFWEEVAKCAELISAVTGFEDSIRKFVTHVVNITYQTIEYPVLRELLGNINGRIQFMKCILGVTEIIYLNSNRTSSKTVDHEVWLERSRKWTSIHHFSRRFGKDKEYHRKSRI